MPNAPITTPQFEDRLDDIFGQYDEDTTGVPKHWKRSRESLIALFKAKDAIIQLIETYYEPKDSK